jgi:predicted HAD superfamily Cof-like phosphohydrolase
VFGLPRRNTPGLEGISSDLLNLRVDLILEEANEFSEAVASRDLDAMADALADLVYVSYGAAVTLGIDLDDVVAEVHMSNMSKLGPDGRPFLRQDGKVLKPETYMPPDIHGVLKAQPPLPRPNR